MNGRNRPASTYQDIEALTASPAQLVVMVYDRLLGAVRRARLAGERQDDGVRLAQLDLARTAVIELLVALNRQEGGAVAASLASLYGYFLGQLTDAGVTRTSAPLDRIIPLITDLRDAFAQAGGAHREVVA